MLRCYRLTDLHRELVNIAFNYHRVWNNLQAMTRLEIIRISNLNCEL